MTAPPPIGYSFNTMVMRWASAAAERTRAASCVTSGPMPSPGRTAIFQDLVVAICGSCHSVRYFLHLLLLRHLEVREFLSNDLEQMAVFDGLYLVGDSNELLVDLVEIAPRELVAELFAALAEGVAAGMLAEHQ